MGIVGAADQIFRIEQDRIIVQQLFLSNRVHVVHVNVTDDLTPWDPQVVPAVPYNDPIADIPPLAPVIELLIQIPCVSEEFLADRSIQPKILEPFLQRSEFDQLRIASKHN